MLAGNRQRERGEKNTGTHTQSPLPSVPLRSSADTSSQLGLIKPADPLLLIDFLIINSVCPSISLRCRISCSHAKALCDLPPSGSQPATDLGGFNPRYTRVGGDFLAFSGRATVYNGAQMKTQDASNNSHLCVKELSNQMWPFSIMDHKTKRTRHNTHVSDSILLPFCVCFPCQCLVKELFHSALKKKNTRGFTRKKPRSTIVATAGRRLVSHTVASAFPLDECFGCTCRDLSGIPNMHTCTGRAANQIFPR